MAMGYNSKGKFVTGESIMADAFLEGTHRIPIPEMPCSTFDIQEPDRTPRSVVAVCSSVSIGRSWLNTIQLEDATVAATHCVIKTINGVVTVRALGHLHVEVNGRKVHTSHMTDDDVILVGNTRLVIDGVGDV